MDASNQALQERITLTSNESAELARRFEERRMREEPTLDDIVELDPDDVIDDEEPELAYEAPFDERWG